jgi:predicted TIM-barrel fold metal-dependent hydrolase
LPSLLAFTSPDHVTFGSDWPYAPEVAVAGMTRMYETFDLDASSRNQIDYGTAAALFPRLAS